MFSRAQQAEIVRSNQKDEYYISYIRNSLADITQSFLGPRSWLKWRQELDLLAETGYFLLTTFAGFQTLGEEYVNIVQVDKTRRAVPSKWRAGSMVLLQVVCPYALNIGLRWLETQVQANSRLTAQQQAALCDTLALCRHIVTVTHRCHLALFYMSGVFYHIAKRVTAIQYVLVRGGMDKAWRPNYRILGWLTLSQLIFTFIQQTLRWFRQPPTLTNHNRQQDNQSEPSAPVSKVSSSEVGVGMKCSLCLEVRRRSTATPCGHLYCWHCITQWAVVKPQCPICRETFQMSQLIALMNFDLT